jgi:hypothetical protein
MWGRKWSGPLRTVIPAVLVIGLLLGCGVRETGRLQFTANGEGFVRQGFVSKDGWAITFDHIYVNLAEITGYQTDPPYDPHAGGEVAAQVEVGLDGTHTVDLAEGDQNAPPILVGEVADAPAGHYNANRWQMVRATDGAASGYSLALVGTAEKDDEAVDFAIQVESEYEYTCGEYVGDERKGILEKDGAADLEMTFHFDHIFGDAKMPMDDELNVAAPGFGPFAAIAGGSGTLEVNLSAMQGAMSPSDYQMLVDILPTLGHVGEGHCHSETR